MVFFPTTSESKKKTRKEFSTIFFCVTEVHEKFIFFLLMLLTSVNMFVTILTRILSLVE